MPYNIHKITSNIKYKTSILSNLNTLTVSGLKNTLNILLEGINSKNKKGNKKNTFLGLKETSFSCNIS